LSCKTKTRKRSKKIMTIRPKEGIPKHKLHVLIWTTINSNSFWRECKEKLKRDNFVQNQVPKVSASSNLANLFYVHHFHLIFQKHLKYLYKMALNVKLKISIKRLEFQLIIKDNFQILMINAASMTSWITFSTPSAIRLWIDVRGPTKESKS